LFFSKNKHILILLIFVILAYLPILSGLVSLTNDARMVTYPIFYYFSDHLSKGEIPWWNYNINSGFPLHADPGTPFWNPIFWLFALLGKNYYIFTLFVWIHIPIAAIGIFKLCGWLKISKNTSLILAAIYICCGYYANHLQHPNNLLEAAFLPYALLYFFKTLYSKNLIDSLYLAVSLFFFINSGYPGFPISACYFFLVFFLISVITTKELRSRENIKRSLFLLLISFLFTVILCLPYLVSLYQISNNFYQAKENVTSDFILHGGITIRSLISLLWPLASMVHEEFYKTDIAWNNMYVGITLLSFFIFSILYIQHKLKYPILFSGIFLLLLSFQGNIKSLLYIHLPGMSLIRSNGEFRAYFILSMLILSGWALDDVLKNKNKDKFKKILFAFICISIIAIIIGGWITITNQNSLQLNLTSIVTWFKNLSVLNAIFCDLCIALPLLLLTWFFIKSKNIILIIIAFDVLINFWICLPYGGIGLTKESEVNKSIQQGIQSINTFPANSPVNAVRDSFGKTKFIKQPSLFSNNISIDDGNAYPSMFISYFNFRSKTDTTTIYKRGIYLKNTNKDMVRNLSLSANEISFKIDAPKNDTIVILQNYSDNWRGFIDNKETKIEKLSETFISMPVEKGEHFIKIKYFSVSAAIAFFVSLLGWAIVILLILFYKKITHANKPSMLKYLSPVS
jgi:hypothetical protein